MPPLLQYLPTETKPAGSTSGGEFAGPCPRCGGTDRFRVWPSHPKSDSGRFWCRRCNWRGDGIDLLRDRGRTFAESCRVLGLGHKKITGAAQRPAQTPPRLPKPRPPRLHRAPGAAWQKEAGSFVEKCRAALWEDTKAARAARAYLTGRGLNEATIRAAGLGINASERRPLRASWGLKPKENKPKGGSIWLPRGIVIPWWKIGGGLWKFRIRRPDGDTQKPHGGPKYVQAAAVRKGEGKAPAWSSNALYGARGLRPGRPAVLVEGVFDALAIAQEARTEAPFPKGQPLAAAVACGTAGGRRPRWIAKLASARPLLLAFDSDAAGEDAAAFWKDVLPHARRHAPPQADPADMLEAGEDLRAWIASALHSEEVS